MKEMEPSRQNTSKPRQSRSGFYFFAAHIKESKRLRTMKEACDAAGSLWKHMPDEEKAPFNEKANFENQNRVRLNCRGIPIGENERLLEESKAKQHSIALEIKQNVESLSYHPHNGLANQNFYFVHMNCFVRTDKSVAVPAELAISQFSLKNGVTKVFSTFLDIMPIPHGYNIQTLSTSKASHRIPTPVFKDEQFKKLKAMTDAKDVLITIWEFIRKNETGYHPNCPMPPLYCVNEEVEVVSLCMETLGKVSGLEIWKNYRIFPLEHLFYHIHQTTASVANKRPFQSIEEAEHELAKDTYYAYMLDLACDFHKEIDAPQFCSRSMVQRWGYKISEWCCQDLGINLQENHHYPGPSDEDSQNSG